jgi:hypothetical protein
MALMLMGMALCAWSPPLCLSIWVPAFAGMSGIEYGP